jgi:hypothetical protein
MTNWFVIINILLLFSSSVLQARYRAHSKRRYSISTQSLVPTFPLNDNNNNNIYADSDNTYGINNDNAYVDSSQETTSKTPPSVSPYQANQEQIEQFTRLIIERLNLKEPPNVTVNVNDETGLPASIFKQLEQQTKDQQRIHDMKETNFYRQQKIQDEIMPTAERAILPGDYIPNNTCQRQISAKLHLADYNLQNVDCFRFTKSAKESKSLPTNQMINELRLYVKKNYFHLNEQPEQLTAEMFQIYQVFRPTSNDTTHHLPLGLMDTTRLAISQVKELNDNWFELTIDSNNEEINIQQIYKQLIMPWYALAIDRDLKITSSMTRSLPIFNDPYQRQYESKKHIAYSLRSENEEENSKESQQQLPYMLVEYGEKIYPSSSGRRGTRDVPTIDLDQGSNALNFVIYPRQLDIGECVGLCGTGGSSLKHTDVKNAQHRNEHNSAYNLLLLQNSLHYNRNLTTQINHPDYHSTQCCSYSRTTSLEIMYTTTNGGPIIRKLIPNMVVEECKCGLPATIQQV